MSLPLGAWKVGTWVIGVLGGAIYAFVEKDTTSAKQLVVIACTIAAVPPTITGIFGLILQARANRKLDESHHTLADVSAKVNGILTKAHADEKAATTRADQAEGFTKGSDSERTKEK